MKKYIHYGHKQFVPELFNQIENKPGYVKPAGGLWASDINAKYGWSSWCEDNYCGECMDDNSFTFTLKEDSRILTINSLSELSVLPILDSSRPSRTCLDFEELSKIYDAIEINISLDDSLDCTLEGWDCDSILVMNSNVIVVIE